MAVIGVTGGTGFIGSHLIDHLMNEGHEVVVVDHVGRQVKSGTELFLADVRDRTAMVELAAHVDAIIHLAAVLGTQETITNPLPAAETNILGGLNILDACRQYKLPLVYAGVGNYWMRNTYSTTKTAVENLLYQYRDEFGCHFAVVRPVNAYGPGQRVAPPFGPGKVRKITPAFVCRALSGMPIEVYGDGSQISDMVHVRDVALVFAETLKFVINGRVPNNPIEVGPVKSCTVRDVAEIIRDLTSRMLGSPPVGIINLPMRPGEKTKPDVDPTKLELVLDQAAQLLDREEYSVFRRNTRSLGTVVRADTSTLKQIDLDCEAFVSLESGLTETIKWFDDQKGRTWNPPA